MDQSTGRPPTFGDPAFKRLPNGKYQLPIFTPEHLKNLAATIPFGDPLVQTYGLALLILTFTFGLPWSKRHVTDEPAKGFLARHLGQEDGTHIVMHRVRNLGEMVLNLLDVPGIEAPLEQLAGGAIESGLAELTASRIYKLAKLPHRFVRPTGKSGSDYDLEVVFGNGEAVCVDAKCKLEGQRFTKSGVINTLNKARKRNLPRDRPGAIILKIPLEWAATPELLQEIDDAVSEFLNSTARIVTVHLFYETIDVRPDRINDGLRIKEIVNPSFDLDAQSTWCVFGDNVDLGSRDKRWLRLISLFQKPSLRSRIWSVVGPITGT